MLSYGFILSSRLVIVGLNGLTHGGRRETYEGDCKRI